jgi:glyoxylase-like metal-dependent hydrolase (beta-lactamase superfamily II)
MIFRQLFEPQSSTYTYLLGDPASGQALLIDPVIETAARDLALVKELGLTLACTLETHVHADHLTAAYRLKELTGSRIAGPAHDRLHCRDVWVEDGVPFQLGAVSLLPLFTPGHTATHYCYLQQQGDVARVFTGDALLIDGCGRTDFQSGDAAALYRSVHERLFTLPEDTLVYPGHDYEGRCVSTIRQERNRNPRLGGNRPLEDFVNLMDSLELPYPKRMDLAVPANELCGDCPAEVPEGFVGYCESLRQG